MPSTRARADCRPIDKLNRPVGAFSRGALAVAIFVVLAACALAPLVALAQPQTQSVPAEQPGTSVVHQPAGASAAEHEPAEHEGGGSMWGTVGRVVNFAILAGTLVYFLRSPFAKYLADRSSQLRRDLVEAAEMRKSAIEQLAGIDNRIRALPGEIELLKTRGAAEIAAEDARMRQAAESERQRLLAQARREIDLHLRVAKQDLLNDAADLAVAVATERIRQTITKDDQSRLLDRYLEQLKTHD